MAKTREEMIEKYHARRKIVRCIANADERLYHRIEVYFRLLFGTETDEHGNRNPISTRLGKIALLLAGEQNTPEYNNYVWAVFVARLNTYPIALQDLIWCWLWSVCEHYDQYHAD